MEIKNTVRTTMIIAGAAILGLIIFIRTTSAKKENALNFTEVKRGNIEISVSSTGELIAERSLDIKGPDLVRNMYFRAAALKVTDLVPEGTIVRKGDYVATLDRSNFANTLKDETSNLQTIQTDYDKMVLDTAVTLTTLRDDIKNQEFDVEEAKIVVDQSRYEPPATQRKVAVEADIAHRLLEAKERLYSLKRAQVSTEIRNKKIELGQQERKVADLQDILAHFRITAPEDGMIVYKKDRLGNKIKAGTILNPFDPSVATLPDMTSIISKIYVSEIEINKIRVGLPVQISVDAMQGKTFPGHISFIANIGEQLPNSDTKVFEVLVRFDDLDPGLRPTMTSNNKVIIRTFDNILYIPLESLHADADNIPFVYTKDKTRQVVIPGESNDKYVIIEKGLAEGASIFLSTPENQGKFTVSGKELISEYRDREKVKQAEEGNKTKVLAQELTGSDQGKEQITTAHE